jgi:hypothetical protein
MNKCENCKYFDFLDPYPELDEVMKEGDSVGLCKRYPPVLIDAGRIDYRPSWSNPIVASSDYCGEFSGVPT